MCEKHLAEKLKSMRDMCVIVNTQGAEGVIDVVKGVMQQYGYVVYYRKIIITPWWISMYN